MIPAVLMANPKGSRQWQDFKILFASSELYFALRTKVACISLEV